MSETETFLNDFLELLNTWNQGLTNQKDDLIELKKPSCTCKQHVVFDQVKVEDTAEKQTFFVVLPGLHKQDINIKLVEKNERRAIEVSLNLKEDSTFFPKDYKQVLFLAKNCDESTIAAKLESGILQIDVFKQDKEVKTINIL